MRARIVALPIGAAVSLTLGLANLSVSAGCTRQPKEPPKSVPVVEPAPGAAVSPHVVAALGVVLAGSGRARGRDHSHDPPVRGGAYVESTAWWTGIEKLPVPRIAVIQAAGEDTGASIVGEVHAAILKAFHCAGVITNGGVRDLPAVMRMGFPMFARNISVSHAYAHLVDTGHPVEIFGLKIHSGDLIYADCHGAISIPLAIASKIPEAAAQIREREQRIIDVCRRPGFSPERLLQVIRSNS